MTFLRRLFLALLTAAGLAFLAACESTNSTPASTAAEQIPEASSATVPLRPGDSLSISLQGIPDPSTNNVQIDERGNVTLPYIGSVNTTGLTMGELRQRVTDLYVSKKFYTTVDVSVSVTERYIYVGGEVTRPGRIVWTPDLTVSKAIQSAGGFTLYAKENKVSLTRGDKAYDVNVTAAQKDPTQDRHLAPGDSVQVPRSPF